MKIVNSMLTKNPCYRAGKKIAVKGLMLHSVGCSQPNASVFVNKWNSPSYNRACVHAFIDAKSGNVYQCLPWDHRGWHGGGSSNNTHIGVEMCEPDCIKYISGSKFTVSDKEKAQEMVKRTYESAVELFAQLCKENNLNPLTDIVSHKEGYKIGIASNHGDPEHLWNGVGLPYTMNTFRNDVKEKLTGNTSTFKPFTVRVSITNLNIRKGAGTSYQSIGACPKGIYTIVEVKKANGYEWGKLKSGLGWIALKYTTRL